MVINGFTCEINCSKCNEIINDSLCEFMNKYYHAECFRCKFCEKCLSIPVDNQINMEFQPPLIDKFGNLVCMNDYIKSLKCKICLKNFDQNSQIHPIQNNNNKTNCDNDDYLAHIECFKCKLCKCEIIENSQYYFDLNENLLCKSCTCENYVKNKKKLKNSERLSSKQKESIKKKISLVENFDELNLDLVEFASEIDCSFKCLLNYIDKQFNKKTSNIECKKQILIDNNENSCSSNSTCSSSMIEQLSKLDRTIAPNKNPFSVQN